MPRYFLEVSYKGSDYAGFQVQQNANTIQAEVEKALGTYYRKPFSLTGSSRTDAGVHAIQNYFHFDTDAIEYERSVYHLNSILPLDIVIKRIFTVAVTAHCRFDAKSRDYCYRITQSKDPFLQGRAYYYPYKLNFHAMKEAASSIVGSFQFESFAKKNIQAKTFDCNIYKSEWIQVSENILRYEVSGNRFLRGMVRGLVGTLLQVGRGKIEVGKFAEILEARNSALVDFSAPAHGLFLEGVIFDPFPER